MAGLAYALRTLPAGTAYAVWVGMGASLTVAYGMWTGDEPISIAKVLLLRPHRHHHRPQARPLTPAKLEGTCASLGENLDPRRTK